MAGKERKIRSNFVSDLALEKIENDSNNGYNADKEIFKAIGLKGVDGNDKL